MNKLYPVFTLKNECQDCYKCVRHCPVKAIKIENGHASVIPEKCIACGLCIKVCPQHAKKVRSDIQKVKDLITTGKDVYVSIAPSWIGVFDIDKEKLIAGIKKLGFAGVSETAIGAQEVSIETAKFLSRQGQGVCISSACPAIVDYIRYYNPEYTDCITKVLSPALAHSKILKNEFGDNSAVVFVGPCSAKKKEADKHPELMDFALTFVELKYWLEQEGVSFDDIETQEESFVLGDAYEGNYYPIEGGMNDTIRKCGVSDVQLMNISTIESLEEALEGLDSESFNYPVFIEALACSGGCLNGPCTGQKKSEVSSVNNVLSYVKSRDEIPKDVTLSIEELYTSRAIEQKEFSVYEIVEKMKSIGKYDIEDELNCGGCGYDTCREFAKALLKEEAETSMCASYMRKIAMKKAGAMLRCMPSGTVIVGSDFKIIETNEAFIKMFAPDLLDIFESRSEGIAGAMITKLVPCIDILSAALKSGKDISKERYSIKDRLYNITAFTIEEDQIVGAVFTDVTKSEMKREEISKKAQEVINKNITTVQEIACLLGEHMVDTELLLNSIAESNEGGGE